MRVLIVPNTQNEKAVAQAALIADWLEDRGDRPMLTRQDAGASGLPELGVERNDLERVDLVVALGGDGTILKAVHAVTSAEPPVLGVNLGRLGFLSGATAEEARDAIVAALEGRATIERRKTLQAEISLGGRDVGSHRALNEVYIGRGASHRALDMQVLVNGTQVFGFSCDGLLVSTPTGSTAYSLSFGGPILSPNVEGTLVVPVGAHTLKARPLMLGPEDVLEALFPNPARADGCVIVDGDPVPCRRTLESVTVRRGERDVLLARYRGRDFYTVVREKFMDGEQ